MAGWFKRATRKLKRAVTRPDRFVGNVVKDAAHGITHPAQTLRDARKLARVVSPALDLAAAGSSFIPGVGTAVASGLATAAAVARNDSPEKIALAAAMGALPGGALVRMAAGGGVAAGKALVRGRSLGSALMSGARGGLAQAPGGALARAGALAAFNAASDVAQGRRFDRALTGRALQMAPAVTQAATQHLGAGRFLRQLRAPDPFRGFQRVVSPLRTERIATFLARQTLAQRPALALLPPSAIEAATGLSARSVQSATRSGPPLAWRPLSARASRLIERFSSIPLAHLSRDTAGLAPDGQTYTVEKGDFGVKIAQKLTGDGNRWRELKAANPQIAKRADPKNFGMVIYPGDVLQLPASWVKSAPRPSAPALTAAVVLKSKGILAVWSKTDGAKAAGPTDYGQRPEDVTDQWTARDRLTLAAFANARGLPDKSGTLTQAAADALGAWAEEKARAVSPVPLPPAPKPPVVLPEIIVRPEPARPVPVLPPAPKPPAPIIVAPTLPTLPELPEVIIRPKKPAKPPAPVVVRPVEPPAPVPVTPVPAPKKPSDNGGLLTVLGAAGLAALAALV